jgi:hypothetical protein
MASVVAWPSTDVPPHRLKVSHHDRFPVITNLRVLTGQCQLVDLKIVLNRPTDPRRAELQLMSVNDAVKRGKSQPEHADPLALSLAMEVLMLAHHNINPSMSIGRL